MHLFNDLSIHLNFLERYRPSCRHQRWVEQYHGNSFYMKNFDIKQSPKGDMSFHKEIKPVYPSRPTGKVKKILITPFAKQQAPPQKAEGLLGKTLNCFQW